MEQIKSENTQEEAKDQASENPNDGCPKSYLLHFHIGKAKNFGRLLRSAAAFGVSEIFAVVKDSKTNKMELFGHQGTAKHMNFRFFKKLKEVREY